MPKQPSNLPAALRRNQLVIGTETVTFLFPWLILKDARAYWGETEAVDFISNASRSTNVEQLSELAALASNPKMAASTIFEASPGIFPLAAALTAALTFAYTGEPGTLDPDEGEDDTNPRQRRSMRRKTPSSVRSE